MLSRLLKCLDDTKIDSCLWKIYHKLDGRRVIFLFFEDFQKDLPNDQPSEEIHNQQ